MEMNNKGYLHLGIRSEPYIIMLERIVYTKAYTMGKMYVGHKVYDTLEPPEREDKPRCIPPGVYTILLEPSPRLNGEIVPELKDVPDFTDIQIHPGNYPQDTAGCILPGLYATECAVYRSRDAFEEIRDYIDNYSDILIHIKDRRTV